MKFGKEDLDGILIVLAMWYGYALLKTLGAILEELVHTRQQIESTEQEIVTTIKDGMIFAHEQMELMERTGIGPDHEDDDIY